MSAVTHSDSLPKTCALGIGSTALAYLVIAGVNKLGYAHIGRWSHLVAVGAGTLAASTYHFYAKPAAGTDLSSKLLNSTSDTEQLPENELDDPALADAIDLRLGILDGRIGVNDFEARIQVSGEEAFEAALIYCIGQSDNEQLCRALIDFASDKGWLDRTRYELLPISLIRCWRLAPYIIEKGIDPFQAGCLESYRGADNFEAVVTAALTYGNEERANTWLTEYGLRAKPLQRGKRTERERTQQIARCVLQSERPGLLEPMKNFNIICGTPAKLYPLTHAAVILCKKEMAQASGNLTTEYNAQLDPSFGAQSPFFHLFYSALKEAEGTGALDAAKIDMMRWLSEEQVIDSKGYTLASSLVNDPASTLHAQLRDILAELIVWT